MIYIVDFCEGAVAFAHSHPKAVAVALFALGMLGLSLMVAMTQPEIEE